MVGIIRLLIAFLLMTKWGLFCEIGIHNSTEHYVIFLGGCMLLAGFVAGKD
jgi:hypothetical protein